MENRGRKIAIGTSEGREFGGEQPLPGSRSTALALELYREDKVSLGRAAELCQTPVAAFMDFAAKHGVPPLRYSFEDLEEERQTADRLKA